MKPKPTYQELEKELEAIRGTNNLMEKSQAVRFLWKNQENWPVEYVSENVEHIFGYTANEFMSGKIVYSKIIYLDDLQRVENEVNGQSKVGFYSIKHEPYRIINKKGEIKWLKDITLIKRNKNKEITHFEGIIFDISKQKETEKALIESEWRWKFAVEGNSDGLWDWNLITNEVFFSTQWKKMLGFSENEIQGSLQEWDKRVHPDDRKKVYEDINKHINGETDYYHNEHRVLCKDNSYKWMLDRGKIISYNSDNKPTRMIGSHSDISGRKDAEQKVINENLRFRAVMDAIDASVYVADMQTHELLFLNKHFKNLFGDRIGFKCYSVVQKEQTAPCGFCTNHLLLDKTGKPKEPYVWEFQNTITKRWYQLRDQAIKWTDNRLVRIEIATDITDRKKVEETLAAKEKLLSVIAKNYPNSYVSVINQDLTVGFTSGQEFYRQNLNPNDYVGLKLEQIFGEYFEIVKENYLKTFKGEETSFELIMNEQYLLYRAVPLLNENNEILQILAVSENITDRKQAEKALQESEAKLKVSNHTKDKFFNIIAHDLKSPFNAILGFTNILLKKHKKYDDEKREKLIKPVYDSAESAYKLLENLLTWSRSQSGQINYSPKKLNLKILLSETMVNLQTQANIKDIKILDAVSVNEEIFADKDMIASVLRNLISNAIKFTQQDGSIVIASEKQASSNLLEISVEDTGLGIPKNRIDDLFLIDKNTSTRGTENETGTGLGLILCKEFTEKHGGKIWIESEIDKGSTFYFTIPYK